MNDPVASIVILCCNHASITSMCLNSIAQHTSLPYELILVDNGSRDETPALLDAYCRQSLPLRLRAMVLRNADNLGFAKGVNQGLKAATGTHVVLLNNDTVLTPGWLEGLVNVAQSQECQPIGLVGAVSNEVPPPQRVAPGYDDTLTNLEQFAQYYRQQHLGKVLEVERVSGFCLLCPRTVIQQVGLLDEQFGLGFFEDDDWGVRIQRAGHRLFIAMDTYIHHWGSQTINNLGLSSTRLLQENHLKFKAKWGDDLANRYQLEAIPTTTGTTPATVSLCMIVKNEEANLASCLECIHDLVSEMVIVDTGSTDQTKLIAERYGAKVIEFPWVDSFSVARNVSVENATSDYIFWLDADDRIDEVNRTKLRQLLTQLDANSLIGYSLKCLCLPDPQSNSITVVDHIRLFPRHPKIRWRYRIHEQILPALREQRGDIQFADVQIQHVGYQDPELRRKKLDRDLRLLHLENQEHPNDPFTLFNLGAVHLERDQAQEAIPLLERSLTRSHPTDSIVRKLYAMLVQAHKRLSLNRAALALCEQGRRVYPQDAELLFQEGLLRRDLGDTHGAIQSLEQLLKTNEQHHFASVDSGLRGYKTRHNLAVLYREQQRYSESIEEWHLVLKEAPGFHAARLGMAEVYLQLDRNNELDQQLTELDRIPDVHTEVSLLRAKRLLRDKRFDEAANYLQTILEQNPQNVAAHILRSHVFLQEGKNMQAAEQTLHEVLRLDPDNQEARHNLKVLHNLSQTR